MVAEKSGKRRNGAISPMQTDCVQFNKKKTPVRESHAHNIRDMIYL